MANVLIVHATTGEPTRMIAGRLAEFASEYGHAATVMDAASGERVPRGRYDAVIVAASPHRKGHHPSAARFVRANQAWLRHLPSAFFSVAPEAAGADPRARERARKRAEAFPKETGWHPAMVRTVAGAAVPGSRGFLARWAAKLAARRGVAAATSPGREPTDWERLRSDLELFLTHAVPAGSVRRATDLRPIFAGEAI
ncbi:MAG TPA: flavodoxin domain-containing protein [Longimicrobium sp.]|nr:flavodoxin domain-containing protein [Longimicrobium sp.]